MRSVALMPGCVSFTTWMSNARPVSSGRGASRRLRKRVGRLALVAVVDGPAAERLRIRRGLHEDLLAVDVTPFEVTLQPEDAVDLVVRNEHGQVEGERDGASSGHALAGIEEHREEMGAAGPVRLAPSFLREELVVRAVDRGILLDGPAVHLPLVAAHAGHDLELVGSADVAEFVASLRLDVVGEHDLVDVEDPVHAQGAEEETREVLIPLLGVHDP